MIDRATEMRAEQGEGVGGGGEERSGGRTDGGWVGGWVFSMHGRAAPSA